MAVKITERAVKIAEGIIIKNGCHYSIYADTMVGARVNAYYKDRFWMVLRTKGGQIIRQSTQVRSVYEDWMQLIAQNGTAA